MRLSQVLDFVGYIFSDSFFLFYQYQALLHYADDIQLASLIVRITESLISGNIHEHSLRARLTQMTGSVKTLVDPFQATADYCLTG